MPFLLQLKKTNKTMPQTKIILFSENNELLEKTLDIFKRLVFANNYTCYTFPAETLIQNFVGGNAETNCIFTKLKAEDFFRKALVEFFRELDYNCIIALNCNSNHYDFSCTFNGGYQFWFLDNPVSTEMINNFEKFYTLKSE